MLSREEERVERAEEVGCAKVGWSHREPENGRSRAVDDLLMGDVGIEAMAVVGGLGADEETLRDIEEGVSEFDPVVGKVDGRKEGLVGGGEDLLELGGVFLDDGVVFRGVEIAEQVRDFAPFLPGHSGLGDGMVDERRIGGGVDPEVVLFHDGQDKSDGSFDGRGGTLDRERGGWGSTRRTVDGKRDTFGREIDKGLAESRR